jgi:hypothetical protein
MPINEVMPRPVDEKAVAVSHIASCEIFLGVGEVNAHGIVLLVMILFHKVDALCFSVLPYFPIVGTLALDEFQRGHAQIRVLSGVFFKPDIVIVNVLPEFSILQDVRDGNEARVGSYSLRKEPLPSYSVNR